MESIAIIGSGHVGTALAKGFISVGKPVEFGVRNPGTARAKWEGPKVEFTTIEEAARQADIVVNATSGESSVEVFAAVSKEIRGKVLVDVANALVHGPDGLPSGLLFKDSSLGERLQIALPETRVVKALNTVFFTLVANPSVLKTPATVFLSGNDPSAKDTVRDLLRLLGWQDQVILDLGDIESARGTEAVIPLIPYLLKSIGFVPFAVTIAR